jgi:hypothetical protein
LLIVFDCNLAQILTRMPADRIHPAAMASRVCAQTQETTMVQSAAQVFSGITAEQYASLQQKAEANGISLSGNSGTAAKFGVEVAWNYVPATLELTFQCLRTPFFVKPEEVTAKIEALVKETLA